MRVNTKILLRGIEDALLRAAIFAKSNAEKQGIEYVIERKSIRISRYTSKNLPKSRLRSLGKK
jgi:hypothetical protein